MRNKIQKLINRWLIGPLFYFYCVIKDKIYKLFRLWPTDGWKSIETENDVQELLDQLNGKSDMKIEMVCTKCLKTWETGHKCGDECKEQPSS